MQNKTLASKVPICIGTEPSYWSVPIYLAKAYGQVSNLHIAPLGFFDQYQRSWFFFISCRVQQGSYQIDVFSNIDATNIHFFEIVFQRFVYAVLISTFSLSYFISRRTFATCLKTIEANSARSFSTYLKLRSLPFIHVRISKKAISKK